jgi:hypothetical protein
MYLMDQLFKSVICLGDAISICAVRSLEEAAPLMTSSIASLASALAPAGKGRGISTIGAQPLFPLFFRPSFPAPANPRQLFWTAWQICRRSLDFFEKVSPVNELPVQWEEVRNKLEAFSLFEHVDLSLNLAGVTDHSLLNLVHRAHLLGPYFSVWATEGVGHYYADSHVSCDGRVTTIWGKSHIRDLPVTSLVPLHAGIGLALVERLLADIHDLNSSEFQKQLAEFVRACRDTFQPEYLEIIYEALGLATRNLYPHLTAKMHLGLVKINEELPEYFWHGVGRALYFVPSSFLPGNSSPWKVFEMCIKESPNEACRRNTVAGFVWALTLVNIRQPHIMAEFLSHHGKDLQEQEAVANGICSAFIIWTRCCPNDNDLTRMNQYQCDGRESILGLWKKYIGEAFRNALVYGSTKSGREHLGKLFRYQSTTRLLAGVKQDHSYVLNGTGRSDLSGERR